MILEMPICGEEGKKVETMVMGGAVIGPNITINSKFSKENYGKKGKLLTNFEIF